MASKYILFRKAFWADTAERTVATAAQAVAATWGADQVFPNALNLDYKVLAGVAAGGALAALVKQLAKLGVTAQVPDASNGTADELENLRLAARRSGGDVEDVPAPPTENLWIGSAPAAPNVPVTDETVYNYSD